MLDLLQQQADREFRRYVCGHYVFCQYCGSILDVDKRPGFVVVVYLDGEPVKRACACRPCLDGKMGGADEMQARMSKGLPDHTVKVEVL